MKNFHKKTLAAFTALCGLVAQPMAAKAQVAPFKTGDRVVFVGNSITDGGHYHSYVWLYYMTRFPKQRIDVFNAGIGGDVAAQINSRFEGDVLPKKPTVIALTFGMNDTKYFEYLRPGADEMAAKAVQTSFESYQQIEKKLQALPAVRKILMASSPYDETVKGKGNYYPGKSKAMLKVAEFQEAAAKKNNWTFFDFNRPMTAINQQFQQKDSTFTICGGDRVHPGQDGHMVMAYLFLKAQGFSNKEVADVVIDAQQKKVQRTGNSTVTALSVTPSAVQFNYLAKALPYPLDTMPRGWGATTRQSEVVNIVPFTQEFNREVFTVKGLQTDKQYTLQIDGEPVGSWSGAQWAEGINLAEISRTPQYQQATAVMLLNEERWELERRFRMHAWMEFNVLKERGLLNKDDVNTMDTVQELSKGNGWIRGNLDNYSRSRMPAIRATWEKQIELLVSTIYSINQPKTRKCIIKLAN
ncbi:SGNH/GDSL hydrolase family protein [Paraflavitalea sp. CAU 1676]|uniref:SGNH/GDSL hydrolase family protein n=1 Tax=Paraflavitalea sp. CAU 1676 TaxID=3032598 RepID=UPI0023DAAC41|nr:SGNH/GDSL hydrolase family protein [Paraflavitalea sp. CAU 1676]MDF2192322.1 SGNH/GDSL hydrolase family protein [Paraflavitalea sp. CAU 1676]